MNNLRLQIWKRHVGFNVLFWDLINKILAKNLQPKSKTPLSDTHRLPPWNLTPASGWRENWNNGMSETHHNPQFDLSPLGNRTAGTPGRVGGAADVVAYGTAHLWLRKNSAAGVKVKSGIWMSGRGDGKWKFI